MRIDGVEKMNSDIFLYSAIIVFSMLVVGLVYTVKEFSKIEKEHEEKKARAKDKQDT